MPAKITFKIVKGKDSGQTFSCEDKDSLILGREKDCSIVLPDGTVSRYHCMLEINPPEVTVRDFGSMNGTFLNEKIIGQRKAGMSAEDGRKLKFNEFPMKDSDKLGLGPDCEIAASIYTPDYCAECRCELPDSPSGKYKVKPGVILCTKCHEKQQKKKSPFIRQKPKCLNCGGPLDEKKDAPICDKCLKDPIRILENLLKNASMDKGDAAKIKGYRQIKLLGRGGMGEVWLVEEESTGKKMALKLMLPRVALNERNRKRFLLEAKLSSALHHPNIVELHKHGCSDGTFFMLMEFCTGSSIDQLMNKHGGILPPKIAVPLIIQLLDGLDYAHNVKLPDVELEGGGTTSAKGLVHRDLSPHNIFLSGSTDAPVAKLADFGLAKAFETAGLTGNTRTGEAAGKPVFMPRQQVINFKYSKPDVDVWAAAASLYNMLTGHFPKDFPLGVDVWKAAVTGTAVPIRKRNPGIPAKLAAAIDKALIDTPQIKIKTAKEFKKMLEKTI